MTGGWLDALFGTTIFEQARSVRRQQGRIKALKGDSVVLSIGASGETGTMEFQMKGPTHGIAVGDVVRVRYRSAAGKNFLEDIEELRLG